MTAKFRLEPFWRVILNAFELSAESLARRAGLPANLFASDPVLVDVDGWVALWNALDAAIDAPDLPLRIGQLLTLDMFDPAHFAAFCSEHLHQAATRLQLYKRLLGPCRLELDDSHGLGMSCNVLSAPLPPRLYGAGELVLWVALVRHATQHHVVPARVTMPVEPDHPGFASFFGTPVTLAPRYEVVFDEEDAHRAFLTTDASMWSFFEPVLERRLAELDDRTTMAERVSAALHELLPSGRSQVGDVARAVGASTRTVQRRLRQEDTSYRHVLEHTRAVLARHYLTQTKLTATEVAFLIGYDDPNSFYTAFRSWTGMTPQAVRAGITSAS